ncbi:MAG: hypothetical protein WBN72_01130 [Nitrososphaeraceae archaeon]
MKAIKKNLNARKENDIGLGKMKQECKCHKCDKEIEEDYYCDECVSVLKQK